MPYVSVTWENGTTSQENILTSVEIEETQDNSHEFILWDDCSLTVEAIEYVLTGDDSLDHCRLPLQSARKLRDFLNTEHVVSILKDAV